MPWLSGGVWKPEASIFDKPGNNNKSASMDPAFKPLEACYDICWTIDPAIWDLIRQRRPCLALPCCLLACLLALLPGLLKNPSSPLRLIRPRGGSSAPSAQRPTPNARKESKFQHAGCKLVCQEAMCWQRTTLTVTGSKVE